jgi:hypothetical protein
MMRWLAHHGEAILCRGGFRASAAPAGRVSGTPAQRLLEREADFGFLVGSEGQYAIDMISKLHFDLRNTTVQVAASASRHPKHTRIAEGPAPKMEKPVLHVKGRACPPTQITGHHNPVSLHDSHLVLEGTVHCGPKHPKRRT